MYLNVAYLEHMLESYLTPVDISDDSVPLKILCCGYYRITEQDPVIETLRPNGRKDYQLLYFHSGQGHFSFCQDDRTVSPGEFPAENGQPVSARCPVTVTAGNLVLFRPGERQVYEYYAADRTEVFWVHFTGSEAESLLLRCGFVPGKQIFWSGISLEYQNLFRRMIKELQLTRPGYEPLIACEFQELLILAYRNRQNPYVTRTQIEQKVNDALLWFDEHYTEPLCVEDYAASVYVSVCWFIRSFRRYVGMTPLRYIINLRMTNARELLLNPSFTVSAVAAMVGYDDPLYFSRIFKKCVGLSPKEYRDRTRIS